MVDGDPGPDVFGMDVARFGEWASLPYTNAKVRENYSRRFSIRFPNEELPAARPLQTTPLYDRCSANAVMGDAGAWRRRSGSRRGRRPKDASPSAAPTISRSRRECRAVRERVGVTEIANFAKYAVTGPGAEAWLDRLLTNRMPRTGRIALTPMLNEGGRLIGDFTMAKAGEERFLVSGSSAGAELPHALVRAASAGRRLGRSSRSHEADGLSIAGPKARDVLAEVTDEDVSTAAFRSWTIREMDGRRRSRPWSAASATPATSATRSGWRRNTSARSTTR